MTNQSNNNTLSTTAMLASLNIKCCLNPLGIGACFRTEMLSRCGVTVPKSSQSPRIGACFRTIQRTEKIQKVA